MSQSELKICEFNLENLFISLAYYDGQDLENITERQWRDFALIQLQRKQKPLARTWGLAKAILDINADILMLVEVGGRESLENFNRYFLQERFEVHFVEGNSQRSIDLGYLVRRGLDLKIEARSNRETPVEVRSFDGNYFTKFSRDVAELRLHTTHGLRLILLLTHLKSKISTHQDVGGKDVRTAEAIALAGIYEDLRRKFPNTPIVVGGDFNTHLASIELELLRHTDLTDFHDILGTHADDRVSLLHFDAYDRAHPQVLDYLLVSPHLKDRVVTEKSYTYRYKSFPGAADDFPANSRERLHLPSDHYPLVLTLSKVLDESLRTK